MVQGGHKDGRPKGARDFFASVEPVLARAIRLFRELSAVKVPGAWLPRFIKLPCEDPVCQGMSDYPDLASKMLDCLQVVLRPVEPQAHGVDRENRGSG